MILGRNKALVINLETRVDRLKYIAQEFHHLFKFDLVRAIPDKNGAEGLKLTMAKLFDRLCEKDDIQNAYIFEDDAKLIYGDSTPLLMGMAVRELSEDYDLLYFGLNLLARPTRVSAALLKVSAAYSSHAILYSRKAMDFIRKNLGAHDGPYDLFLSNQVVRQGNSYCTSPMLITQKDFTSDIAAYDDLAGKPGAEKYLDPERKIIRWGLMMEDRYQQYTKNI